MCSSACEVSGRNFNLRTGLTSGHGCKSNVEEACVYQVSDCERADNASAALLDMVSSVTSVQIVARESTEKPQLNSDGIFILKLDVG
jgi:hypothetical protein